MQKNFRFSEDLTRFYAAEILLALEAIHHVDVYRELRLETCVLDSKGHIKLTDYGISKYLTTYQSNQKTPEYYAPEAFKDTNEKSSDFWSLGVIIFTMLNGRSPYSH